jgi:hypothetical protein
LALVTIMLCCDSKATAAMRRSASARLRGDVADHDAQYASRHRRPALSWFQMRPEWLPVKLQHAQVAAWRLAC